MGAFLLLATMGAACLPVHAQVQRSFVNPSFEAPVLPGNACWSIRESADVPGWDTTEPPYSGSWGSSNHGSCGGHPDLPVIGAIQIFKNGVDSGLIAPDGEQWAELNAFTARRLYQSVCMAEGERVDWSLAHRGRGGTQVMQFNIGSDPDGTGAQAIVQARSSTDGGSIDSCGLGTCEYSGTVNTWGTYSGSFIWTGGSGMQTVGFESLTGGNTGNYLDNIRLTLRPYIEFYPADAATIESAGDAGAPALRVSGVIDVPVNVTVEIVGGTAVPGTDFSAPGTSFIVTIPAADYGTGAEIALPLSAIDNAIIQDNRTVQLRIFEDPENYAIGSTSVCGMPANEEVTWTLIDDDVDLAVSKEVDDETPAGGESVEYTVIFSNNTARPTLGPLDAHDATALVEDLVPAGLSFDSWTCQASNGASCPGGAVDGSTSGSGPISGSAFLPGGDGAAGGQLVYSITASFQDAPDCEWVTNTASIAAPAGLQEGDAADDGFVTPVPGGTANNTAQIDVQRACGADLSITKDDGTATYAPGLDLNYTIVVANAGPADVVGARVSDPLPAGVTAATWTCGDVTGGAACGAASGTGGIDSTADLPSGGSVTYLLHAGVSPDHTGELTNTATVTAPDGVNDSDPGNNQASDTNSMEEPPVSGLCSPRAVGGAGAFAFAPFPVSATWTRTGTPAWNGNGNWTTTGGDFTWAVTFSEPVPAEWIRLGIADVNGTSDGAPYNPTITIGVSGPGATATASDFTQVGGDLQYNPGTGRLTYTQNPFRQSAVLDGSSQGLVRTLQVTATGLHGGDFIALSLSARPACMTVSKVSEEGTGSFTIEMTNVAQADGTEVPSVTLATSAPDTPVSTPEIYSIRPGALMTLSEAVPEGWNLESATCTDRNAGNTGNPTVIGSFASPTVTIPDDNVRPGADIHCLFTNQQLPTADLAIEKTVSVDEVTSGDEVAYTLVVSNSGPAAADGALVTDPGVPDSLECTALVCSADGGAVCPGAPTAADLAAGLSIPTFPAGGTVTLELSCTVTATGD